MDNFVTLLLFVNLVGIIILLPDLVETFILYFRDLRPRKMPFNLLLKMKLKDIKSLVHFVKEHDIVCISPNDFERRS